MPIATKLGRVVTFNEELPSIKSENPLIMWSCNFSWQIKYAISPLPQWPFYQNWQGGSIQERVLKSQNLLITWSFKVTWQIKYVISLLLQDIWILNLARWWVTIRGSTYKVRQPFSAWSSLDKLKTFYLYPNAWSHQSWQRGDLGWGAPDHKVTWPFKQVVI